MKTSGNKILITGGATGIGLGLAGRFLEENNTIIICGRRESVLKEARQKFPSLIAFPCDLSVVDHRERLFQWISAKHPDLNVLINNAGIQNWMTTDDADFYQRAKEEIAINLEAPLHLVSLFSNLSSLTTIINVTSALAYIPLVRVPVYSATKAFFHSLTLSMREMMNPEKIEVIELIPPTLNTDLGGKGIHTDLSKRYLNNWRQGKMKFSSVRAR